MRLVLLSKPSRSFRSGVVHIFVNPLVRHTPTRVYISPLNAVVDDRKEANTSASEYRVSSEYFGRAYITLRER